MKAATGRTPPPIRSAGLSISAARSHARWPLSKRRRPNRARPISSPSGFPARSAISTGASRWNGGKITRASPPGSRPSPRASRPSSARARPLREGSPMTPSADTPAVPPTWTSTPSKPKLKLPPGACDAHVLVFGPRARFPFGGSYVPSDAPKETLFERHAFLGIERCVIVHSDAQGFRGVRFHYMEHLGTGAPIDEVIKFGARLADIGWHLQIHMAAERIG